MLALMVEFFNRDRKRSFNYKQVAHGVGATTTPQKQMVFQLLEGMAEQNFLIEVSPGKYKANSRGTEVVGRFERRVNGKNHVITDEKESIFIAERNSMHAMDGDRVRVLVYAKRKGHDSEGEVVEIIEKNPQTFVGTLEVQKHFAFLLTDNKVLANDIFIPKNALKGGKTGDKAVVRITEWPDRARNPYGEVVDILGPAGENNTEIHAILAEFGLPYRYPESVEKAANKIPDTIHDFGMERTPNEKIVIFGGNQISGYLASKLEKDDNIQSVRIIDEDEESAQNLADKLTDTVVIHGEMMSDVILTEAGIHSADAAIAITTHDKDNLLASLLAKKSGVASAISLVNSRSYDNLIDNVSDNILIDRSSVTISSMLQELRKAKLNNAYSLGRGFGEVWEIKVDADSLIAGRPVSETGLPKTSMIAALFRDGMLIFPSSEEHIEAGDLLIVFVSTKDIRKVEHLLN